jgi:hypothetical protein
MLVNNISDKTYFIDFHLLVYYILAGVPGVARDEKLQKQIFEIP